MLHQKALVALALVFFSSAVTALDIGFESLLSVNASDNVGGANAGLEQEGQLGYVQFGVFGEQKGTRVRGAFSGELISQKQLDDEDDDFSAITQFIGAAEAQITPRAFSWYVGDILGSVRADDGLQSIDELSDARRNVFVTGPRFNYELDSFSRVNARFLYVNQSEDDRTLETLYNTTADWSFDTDRGNTWGLSFGNIYTDNPEENLEGDFNRLSLAATWARTRGRNTYEALLGGTRYDTEEESLNGLNARLALTRQLGPQTDFRISFTQDLRDQTLNTVDSLLTDGSATASDGDGFFDESRLDMRYAFASSATVFDIGAYAGLSDFRLLADNTGFSDAGDAEDRVNMGVSVNYGYIFSPRTRLTSTLSLEQQDYQNRDDYTQSALGTVQVIRRLSRSFEFQVGYRVNVSQGERTRLLGDASELPENIDVVENRVTLGLRWAPPTRASKDLTIEMKSLLQ